MTTAKTRYLDRRTDSWTDALLTTDHAASSYGQPVLVVGSQVYCAGDVLPGTRIGSSPATARDNVTAAEFVADRRAQFGSVDDDPSIFDEDGLPEEDSARIDRLIDSFLSA